MDKNLLLAVQILLIAGAINWGLVAYNKTDLVTYVAGEDIGRYIKFVVAAAGLLQLYNLAFQK